MCQIGAVIVWEGGVYTKPGVIHHDDLRPLFENDHPDVPWMEVEFDFHTAKWQITPESLIYRRHLKLFAKEHFSTVSQVCDYVDHHLLADKLGRISRSNLPKIFKRGAGDSIPTGYIASRWVWNSDWPRSNVEFPPGSDMAEINANLDRHLRSHPDLTETQVSAYLDRMAKKHAPDVKKYLAARQRKVLKVRRQMAMAFRAVASDADNLISPWNKRP